MFERGQKCNPGARGLWGPFYDVKECPDPPRCRWINGIEFSNAYRARDYDLPERYANDWLVVFDELGVSRDPTDFVAEAIYRFCASRYGKWTVFTTNLILQEIVDRVDARVGSRLIRDDNRLHRITAGDYALRKRN